MIGSVLFLVCAFFALRWLLRELILPKIRGGFTGKPCVLISDHGFVDRRILRDFVPWEDVEAIKYQSNGSKMPDSIVVTLSRPYRRRDAFLGKAMSRRVVIWEGVLTDLELYPALRAHLHQWRIKAAEVKNAARSAPPLSSQDQDTAAPHRDNG